MNIKSIDHIVLTVKSIEKSLDFYVNVLNMQKIEFKKGKDKRYAIKFGNMKINLHETDHEFEPKDHLPTPGSEDFCLITKTPIEEVITELKNKNIKIIEGPETNPGALGAITSIYLRDPDKNLVEISNYKNIH
ncbi:VOC family protein [Apilactobacillus timberlakei]|uniref:VOC family protein n=1 Tax=Apilactobacillus timberlakei TaxID=2008380 RepID=A0ABY2YT84_9LACO|nr:VOC family protein [Apilactobacillus timberlakei]TPR14279.1 VOC family protein [Apilactobacillus timberlakei]TPR16532.1 VOC family protein [Apilactobacillus timberlakei]